MAHKAYKKSVRIMLIIYVLIKNEIKWTNMVSIFKNCGLMFHVYVLQLVQMYSISYITCSSPLFSFSRQVALRSRSSARALPWPWAVVRWLRGISECGTLYDDGQSQTLDGPQWESITTTTTTDPLNCSSAETSLNRRSTRKYNLLKNLFGKWNGKC